MNKLLYYSTIIFIVRVYSYYGDFMLKKCLPYLLAVIMGIFVGYYMFDGEIHLSNILNKSNYTGFQIGVYTDLENAKKIQEKYTGSILVSDEELYRVYYAILHNKKNIELMEKYLQVNKINYYLKDMEINDLSLISELDSIESLMGDDTNSLFLELNKKILVSYEGYQNEIKSVA